MVKRRAVVVGVGKYQDPRISPLKYALSDASKINGLLEHLPDGEFEVRQILNGSAQDVFEALDWAVEGLSGGDLFFFYFAGHGVQQEFSGQHLLLCNDARSKTFGSNHSLGVVPHSYLKEIAHDLPCDCLFCFDACRTPVYKGMREAMAVMEGSRAFRDIVTANNSGIGRSMLDNLVMCRSPASRRTSGHRRRNIHYFPDQNIASTDKRLEGNSN